MTTASRPDVVFASPRKLPRANDLGGRVVVLDIAFAAVGLGKGFEKTTGKFIEKLGARLARWVDHHDHPLHERFKEDTRFVLCTKAEHGACPEMITPELVTDTGPIDTILCHFDLDGLYAAAKWMLGGHEPYPGADDDARAVDTRIGKLGTTAVAIDNALRARWIDDTLKRQILNYLVGGLKPGTELDAIQDAAKQFQALKVGAKALAARYTVADGVALLEIPSDCQPFDKTELLLMGQALGQVAIVVEAGNATIAARFDSGLDFVSLLEIGGGMPTRVNIPKKRLDGALLAIKRRLRQS